VRLLLTLGFVTITMTTVTMFTTSAAEVNLPNTDGYGLVEKLEPLSKSDNQKLGLIGRQSCANKCVTPYGTILGEVDGVIAYSNCKSRCVKPEYSYMNLKTKEVTNHKEIPTDKDLHYVGVIHQCVEYSRKWWMHNLGITYGSIDSAFEIIYLTEGKDIYTNEKFPLGRSINTTAKRPPQRGDLVIYGADRTIPVWRHGHVAVVVGVDLNKGIVSLAEENYNNQPWQDPKHFARQIQLFEVSGRYTLLDINVGEHSNKGGAAISGWIYPKR